MGQFELFGRFLVKIVVAWSRLWPTWFWWQPGRMITTMRRWNLGPPSDVGWFIKPIKLMGFINHQTTPMSLWFMILITIVNNYIAISIIDHSSIGVSCTNLAIENGGPTLYHFQFLENHVRGPQSVLWAPILIKNARNLEESKWSSCSLKFGWRKCMFRSANSAEDPSLVNESKMVSQRCPGSKKSNFSQDQNDLTHTIFGQLSCFPVRKPCCRGSFGPLCTLTSSGAWAWHISIVDLLISIQYNVGPPFDS